MATRRNSASSSSDVTLAESNLPAQAQKDALSSSGSVSVPKTPNMAASEVQLKRIDTHHSIDPVLDHRGELKDFEHHHPELKSKDIEALDKEEEEKAEKGEDDGDSQWEVQWDEGEKDNPKNWSKLRRWYITIFASALLLNVTLASSAPSGSSPALKMRFNTSQLETTLVTSVFVAGFIVGPLFWAPLSELYGRRIIFLYTLIPYCGWLLGCALAPNLEALLVLRFLAGTFAAAPITNSGGICSDVWSPLEIGTPLSLFSVSPFLGPILGPLMGGFLGEIHNENAWRYIHWLDFAVSVAFTIATIFTLPETYSPTLLVKKAKRLREETGEKRWWAKNERLMGRDLFLVTITRPPRMFVKESILALVCLYISFVYGLIYLLFIAYPIVFQGYYHMTPGVASLPFLGTGLGAIIGLLFSPYFNRIYRDAYIANGNKPVPEKRLVGSMSGAITLVIGLFMFAGTAHVHWILPTISGVFLGYGILWCFISFLSYLTDCYKYLTASAFAASAVTRSICGAALPLFANRMYTVLGTAGASALLGGAATLLLPVPFLFYKYGEIARKKSSYAFE